MKVIYYNIAKAPLYYVRGGGVNLSVSRLRAPGVNGYDRSSRSYSTPTNAYGLGFNATGVSSSDYSTRYYAFPLRVCIKSLTF